MNKNEYVKAQWDKMTPRERVLGFRLSRGPITSTAWEFLTEAQRDTIMKVAEILGLDKPRSSESYSFTAPAKEKVTTHH
jgi:hypothetical protein